MTGVPHPRDVTICGVARPIGVLALLCWSMLPAACSPKIPDRVTADGLLALKKGMSYEDVEALVGPPLCVIEEEPYQPHCHSEPVSVPAELRNKRVALSFAENLPWSIHPFKIYVNLANGSLTGVYIKYDDLGVCCMDGLPTSPFYWIGSRDFLRKEIGR